MTSKYNTAKAAYEQAQQTEADKKTEYDRLAEVAKQKKSALENATSDYNKANDEYNTASANVKALEQQISELKANMTVDTDAVKAGLLGFMNHIASSTSFTAAQRANASDAAKLLDGSASKAAWYDDYVNLDASDADNAISLVNLQNTLTHMNAVNGIRRANGLSDMKVSIVSMAQSALDVCYSSNVWDHAGNSGEGFYMSYNENLAGRAGAYKGSDNPKDWETSFDNGDKYGDDWPFIGWYTAEKRDYDRGDYSNTGHYENFIDSGANSFGFAVGYGKDGNRSTPEDDGAPSPVSIYQGNWAEGDFTVDEFKNLVNTYVDSVYHAGGTAAQKAQLAQLQDQLAAARKARDVKNDALGSAESSLAAAKSAANEANGNVAAAKSDYEAAQEATAIAKAAYGAADVNLKNVDIETPRANLNAAKDEATVAQAALDDANFKLTECQTNASKASARKAKAQGDYDTAKTKSDKANEAYGNATASVKDLAAKRDAAQADLANKQGSLDEAKKADDAAQAGVDKAQAADVQAAIALSDAKQAVAAKAQTVSDAQAKAKAAEGELVGANKAFERFAGAQKAVDDAKAAYDAAVAGVADAQKQLEAANEAVVDATFEIVEAKAELANDEALKADLEAVDHKASLAAGTTGNEKLVKLNAAYARYKAAVDAAAGLKAALSDADAKLSDANDAYAAALAELGDAKDALAAAQAEYDKYHPKAEPQAKPQVAQAAAKAPVAKKQAAPAALAQTGDNSALAGEVFVIGGVTLVAAGVTLGDRRRKQM